MQRLPSNVRLLDRRPQIRRLRHSFERFITCLFIAGAVLGGLPHRASGAPPEIKKARTLIARLGRGQLNQLWLEATIEGVKGVIMVDTGCDSLVLNEDRYNFLRHGSNRKLPPGVPATTRVNDLASPVVMARDFRLGGNDLGGSPAALIPPSELHESGVFHYRGRTSEYDGLLGETFLRYYRAVIDCRRQLLYLNLGTVKPQALANLLPAHGWTRVPMAATAGVFSVPCTLAGHAYQLIVDTGAPFTFLEQSVLDAANVRSTDLPLSGGVIGGDMATPLKLVSLDRLQIGAYTAANVKMTASYHVQHALITSADERAPSPIIGLLGDDTLADNGAIIDIGGQALYLKHLPAGPE